MKRILIIVCVLAMSALPAMVSAQGLPALGGIPGVGSFGSLFGSTGPCGEADPGLLAPPTFYVGYVGQGRGVNFGVGFDQPIGGVFGLDHTYDMSALALGISMPFTFSDRISVIASGWWVVPSTTRSLERYDPNFAQREWSAETNWWWVDALVAYNLGGGWAALGGFRYDKFETKFKNPEDVVAIVSLPGDESTVTSNGYIPLLGIMYSAGSAANMLTAYAVGFPTLLGHVDYHQTVGGAFGVGGRFNSAGDYDSGYFFEARLDYQRRVLGEADLGAFFRFNATRGSFSGSSDEGLIGLPTVGGFKSRGGLNRKSLSVGGTINIPFRLPFI